MNDAVHVVAVLYLLVTVVFLTLISLELYLENRLNFQQAITTILFSALWSITIAIVQMYISKKRS